MKLIHFSATLAAGVLLGGVLGWVLKPQAEIPRGNGKDTALERQRPTRPVAASSSRFAAELQAIKDRTFQLNRDDPGKDSAYLEGLARVLLNSSGGYARMKNEEMVAFHSVLDAMAKKDLKRTLDWIDQSLKKQDRTNCYRNAIRAGMKDSPVRDHLDLFKSRDFTTGEIGDYAGHLMLGY